MYRDQNQSDSEGNDEETMSETIDIEDGAETASETGDGRVMVWNMKILETVTKLKSKTLKKPQLAIL